MEYEFLGWVDDSPTLSLPHKDFAYAGKFNSSGTGKAVARSEGNVIAAVSFNQDRRKPAARIRYITVRKDCRGKGVGPHLADFIADRLLERYESVRISVNNPYAYQAMYKAGFEYTGEIVGLRELVMERPLEATSGYGEGIKSFLDKDISEAEERYVRNKLELGSVPPPHISASNNDKDQS